MRKLEDSPEQVLQKLMNSRQMNHKLVQLLRSTIEKLNLCVDTYYHTILVFNLIGTDQNHQRNQEPLQESDKILISACLFLTHKLYEPTVLKISALIDCMEIDPKYQDSIISLEIQILSKLSYKIQNLLPSNQTLFASLLWDQFVQKIDQTCIDVNFGIPLLIQHSKKQMQTKHYPKITRIQPEFKPLQNHLHLQSLTENVDILVHSVSLYEFYIRKELDQSQKNVETMKKIGLAITYATILERTQMSFNKKYRKNQNQNFTMVSSKNQYFQFVFNDFLQENYGLKLDDLKEQIQVVNEILTSEKCVNPSKNSKIKWKKFRPFESSYSNTFTKSASLSESPIDFKNENKENICLNLEKKNKSRFILYSLNKKVLCHSILGKKQTTSINKHLQSTLCQSKISQTAKSFIANQEPRKSGVSIHKKYKTKGIFFQKTKKSSSGLNLSYQKNQPKSGITLSSDQYKKSAQNQDFHEGHYKVSQFFPVDA